MKNALKTKKKGKLKKKKGKKKGKLDEGVFSFFCFSVVLKFYTINILCSQKENY